ncbi:MAG: GerMN domain-containing protein [Synergistaceae bacterium]|nr:GerMN domain-containing protein [Synergistaceae bacterium]
MRDPEERTRHFIIRNKKEEENFDEPTVKRISAQQRDVAARERKIERQEGKESLREGFFARHSGKGKTENERANSRLRDGREEDYEEYGPIEEEDYSKKAPLLVRIFAWIALLAIFFVCGYLGANYFFNWADKKGGSRIGNVIGSGSEAARVSSGTNAADGLGNVKYKIYIPEGTAFTEREIEIEKGMAEEDIEKVVSVYIDGLKETKMLDNDVRLLNIFRSGDWLYLDMTSAFSSSLKTLGRDKAGMVITGLVRTMKDNFPPVKKVKFYIDGKESGEKTPADLTKAWEIN